MPIFRVADCPRHQTMMSWIKACSGWSDSAADCETLSVPGLTFDVGAVAQELEQLFNRVNPVYWKSQPPGALWGLSLTCNPDAPRTEWHHGSFGSERYRHLTPEDYFEAPSRDLDSAVMGDYLDSLSFRRRLPELQGLTHLNRLLDGFQFPVVRSTVRVIDGTAVQTTQPGSGGMHLDFPTSEFLRINICITGNQSFGLEYDNGLIIYDCPGNNVVVNTDRHHRAWIGRRSNTQRAHLVIDIAPWLNYDAEHDAWELNQYFNKVHPFDMVRQGLVYRQVQ